MMGRSRHNNASPAWVCCS